MCLARYLLLILLCLPYSISAQLADDFNDGSLTNNILWDGDIEDFIINDDFQLQLSAAEAGNSYIHAPLSLEGDSLVFRMDFGMQFKPSSGNKLRIYLAMDQSDPAMASGYCIEIGENGSDDAVILYRLENGEAILIGRGIDGRYAESSKMSSLEANYFDGEWTIYSERLMDGNKVREIMLQEASYDMRATAFFGIECTYTSTRKNKFFFDNINIGQYVRDRQAPQVQSITVQDDQLLSIVFSEKMDSSSTIQRSSYVINDQEVAEVVLDDLHRRVIVTSAEPYDATRTHRLIIKGVMDISGNPIEETSYEFRFLRPAYKGSILLSEVLTDPYPEGEDFIELYNPTEEFISLKNCTIYNRQNDKEEIIMEEVVIGPKTYLALSPDTLQLVDIYQPEDERKLYVQELPPFNNASANISLFTPEGDTLDSYDYDEAQHFPLLKNTEGVSLERVDLTSSGTAWHSASSTTRYATPGYKNSNTVSEMGDATQFSLGRDSFSPDNDGYEDVLPIHYTLNRSGYTATIRIYTAEGYPIATLQNNELLGRRGTLTWDGITDSGDRASIGHYILVVDGIHPEGGRLKYKEAFAIVYPF